VLKSNYTLVSLNISDDGIEEEQREGEEHRCEIDVLLSRNNGLYSEAVKYINANFIFNDKGELTTIKFPTQSSAFFKWYQVCYKDKLVVMFKSNNQDPETVITTKLKGLDKYINDQYNFDFLILDLTKIILEYLSKGSLWLNEENTEPLPQFLEGGLHGFYYSLSSSSSSSSSDGWFDPIGTTSLPLSGVSLSEVES